MCTTCADGQHDPNTVVGVELPNAQSMLDHFGQKFPEGTNWRLQVAYRVDTQTTPCTDSRGFTEDQRVSFGRTWWFWRADLAVLEPIHDGNARRLATTWVSGLLQEEWSTSPRLGDAVCGVVFRATAAHELLQPDENTR